MSDLKFRVQYKYPKGTYGYTGKWADDKECDDLAAAQGRLEYLLAETQPASYRIKVTCEDWEAKSE